VKKFKNSNLNFNVFGKKKEKTKPFIPIENSQLKKHPIQFHVIENFQRVNNFHQKN
jgi:hypothetical protein